MSWLDLEFHSKNPIIIKNSKMCINAQMYICAFLLLFIERGGFEPNLCLRPVNKGFLFLLIIHEKGVNENIFLICFVTNCNYWDFYLAILLRYAPVRLETAIF
jgi:hypothetical protein